MNTALSQFPNSYGNRVFGALSFREADIATSKFDYTIHVRMRGASGGRWPVAAGFVLLPPLWWLLRLPSKVCTPTLDDKRRTLSLLPLLLDRYRVVSPADAVYSSWSSTAMVPARSSPITARGGILRPVHVNHYFLYVQTAACRGPFYLIFQSGWGTLALLYPSTYFPTCHIVFTVTHALWPSKHALMQSNYSALHSTPVYLNQMNSAVLRMLSGDVGLGIKTIMHPFPGTVSLRPSWWWCWW